MPAPISQSTFREALLDPVLAVPEGLTDGQGRSAGRRFSVYRNNVVVSLTEALAEGFPAVQKLIGETNFRNIAGVYLRQNPPQSPLMMVYGEGFPGFLAAFAPLAHLPYLADVARLEQALRESYHAADHEPIDPQALADLSPEALAQTRMALAPALRVIGSDFPVHAIWAYNMQPDSPKPEPVRQSVLITRPSFDPETAVITAAEAEFICALDCDTPLGIAAETATGTDSGFDLARVLGLLLSGNAIISLSKKD